MSVVIVGSEAFGEARALADAVDRLGGDAFVAAVERWPGETIELRPDDRTVTVGEPIPIEEIDGLYVNPLVLFQAYAGPHKLTERDDLEDVADVGPALSQLREHRSLFRSLCGMLESRGVPVLPAVDVHTLQQRKPWQLDQFERAGIPVPDTVFTNDPETVRSFSEQHDQLVYKPVSRGAPPGKVTEEDLDEDRLEHLSTAPVQFQAFVPGEDLRVYVLDGTVLGGMRYETEQFSFKLDQRAGTEPQLESIPVPDDVRSDCREACSIAGLTFGAVDVRRRPDGSYAILEANPAPAFAAADAYADLPVADSLASYFLDRPQPRPTEAGAHRSNT